MGYKISTTVQKKKLRKTRDSLLTSLLVMLPLEVSGKDWPASGIDYSISVSVDPISIRTETARDTRSRSSLVGVTKGLCHWQMFELRHFLTSVIGQNQTIDIPP